jgi:hypothetical protein
LQNVRENFLPEKSFHERVDNINQSLSTHYYGKEAQSKEGNEAPQHEEAQIASRKRPRKGLFLLPAILKSPPAALLPSALTHRIPIRLASCLGRALHPEDFRDRGADRLFFKA